MSRMQTDAKMLQRSNFLDRTTSKALQDTSKIITRPIVKRCKIVVTKKSLRQLLSRNEPADESYKKTLVTFW